MASFSLRRVARNLNDFHAVLEGTRNGIELVGCRDKHHLREVEGDVQIVVREQIVLLGIENFEEGRGGIAAEIRAKFVNLIKHNQRIIRFAFF